MTNTPARVPQPTNPAELSKCGLETRSHAMHYGDYRTPGTQPHQLLRLLMDGKEHTPPEIARELGTTNPTTIVSALRIALNADDHRFTLPRVESRRAGDGTLLHFYKLRLRRPMQVEMFPETERHLQGVGS